MLTFQLSFSLFSSRALKDSFSFGRIILGIYALYLLFVRTRTIRTSDKVRGNWRKGFAMMIGLVCFIQFLKEEEEMLSWRYNSNLETSLCAHTTSCFVTCFLLIKKKESRIDFLFFVLPLSWKYRNVTFYSRIRKLTFLKLHVHGIIPV